MNGFIRLFVLSVMTILIASCAGAPVEEDLSLEGTDTTNETAPVAGTELGEAGQEAKSKSSGFDNSEVDKNAQAKQQESVQGNEDLSLDQDLNKAESAPQPSPSETVPAAPAGSDIAETKPAPAPAPAPTEKPIPPTEVAPTENPFAEAPQTDIPAQTPPPSPEPAPAPVPAPAPEVAETAPAPIPTPAPEMHPALITDLKFKANESGGTIVIKADKPLSYTTRANPELHQFVVEVDNATLPDRLKRSLNTRDIKGSVGAIDAYQNPGSTTARFVIQLREGFGEPTVQAEGSSLLVVASGASPGATPNAAAVPAPETSAAEVVSSATESDKILPSKDLGEFLAGNTKFYGKKISIETKSMDIRDALNFITEESGVNMVVADEVKGNISLKLRQVPWDQALVVIMKARKLGYTRQGNVLRIAPLSDLKAEEDDATKLAQTRKTVEPLKVRMFPVSYAKVDELEKKIKDFLGERGKAVGDVRTNSLVVTDIEDNLDRVSKLIASLDIQPPQVLIEGKIVEAQETFIRSIGVNWGATGSPIKLGSTSRGPVNMNPSFNINPAANTPGNLNFNLSIGTLDYFGTLQAALSLKESEDQVKVISAPRIMTMTNEKADISQTTEVAVKQVTTTTSGTQETFQFKPLTMKLEVTPQVTADGSVIMKVNVNRQFQGADTSGAGSGAFAVNSREANTRVLVKNGETAVIGGIYQSDATDGETGVPWFREIPVLGYLFKTKNIKKDKSELLIFLTPRIVGQVGGPGLPPAKEL
ncbi:MAG: type IV pilus secretin PilQ [Pseudobdellovibrionaceae bacterium]